MKVFTRSALVALILVVAAVIVASPAFATPRLTTSTGNAAVSPFITPITPTTSSFTGRSSDSVLAIDLPLGLSARVQCRTAIASGYVSTTHTQARITSLSFGDGGGDSLTNCVVRTPFGDGTVDRDSVTCTATSRAPWHLHVRSTPDGGRSWDGTVNTSSPCTFVTTAPRASSCRITVDANQSISARYTNANGTLELDRTSVLVVTVVNVSGCRISDGSYTATFTGRYTIRPDTRNDARPTVTAIS